MSSTLFPPATGRDRIVSPPPPPPHYSVPYYTSIKGENSIPLFLVCKYMVSQQYTFDVVLSYLKTKLCSVKNMLEVKVVREIEKIHVKLLMNN